MLRRALGQGIGGKHVLRRRCSRLSSEIRSVIRFGDVLVESRRHPAAAASSRSSLLAGDTLPREVMMHLEWIAKKYNLRQDMILLGHPSNLRRQLAMKFFRDELGLDVEYVSISKDTTESDLKQRREMNGDSITFVDQAPVRAAKLGRVLVLDGLEKAERNVLPCLNNLLENREMALEDGTFLMSNENYHSIMSQKSGRTNSSSSTPHPPTPNPNPLIVPCHPDFVVCALALPSPPYAHRSMDPPLRSRFNARFVDELRGESLLSLLPGLYSMPPAEQTLLLSFYESLGLAREAALGESKQLALLPLLSLDGIKLIADLFNKGLTLAEAVEMVVPQASSAMSLYVPSKHRRALCAAFDKLKSSPISPLRQSSTSPPKVTKVLLLPEQKTVLNKLLAAVDGGAHACIVSSSGAGKSRIARALADIRFSGALSVFPLFQEMTARDLLQRRSTDNQGNTIWIDSPIVIAARLGGLVVLDGYDRIDGSALSSLRRLMAEGRAQLPDGSELECHPTLRLLALSLPPATSEGMRDKFMNELPLAVLFLDGARVVEERLEQLKSSSSKVLNSLLPAVVSALNGCGVADLGLSLRSVCRLEAAVASSKSGDDTDAAAHTLRSELERSLIVPFLPRSVGQTFDKVMKGFCRTRPHPDSTSSSSTAAGISIQIATEGGADYLLLPNGLRVPRRTGSIIEKVPRPLFHSNHTHEGLLQALLQTIYGRGERSVLLLGNQGVGKNKVTDRLLQLLNYEREYIQLHRDTTISSLTLVPSIVNGRIVYEDSPLVVSCREGRCLVIDEADKAPTEVIAVLKALVEEGELLLADGRRIIRRDSYAAASTNDSRTIYLHDDFMMIVLANRPGYPFLGNNLFAVFGGVFSTFIVDNPDLASEARLLQAFGAGVSPDDVMRIAGTFSGLREEYASGALSYPFSSRDAVAIVKHLSAYPSDGIAKSAENVLDFDRLSPASLNHALSIFEKNGISFRGLNGGRGDDDVSGVMQIERRAANGSSVPHTGTNLPKHGKVDPNNKPHVGGNTWAGGSGGSDTAGLGGRGGPYRLDSGHPVHQVSEEAKREVSAEARAAAKRAAIEAFNARMVEINMHKGEYTLYETIRKRVEKDITILRGVFEGIANKRSERVWLRNQQSGEIDDSKLVDGLVGDRLVFKRRGRGDTAGQGGDSATDGPRKKKLHFLVDVSASMYRFNGLDNRLERMLESVLLVVESMPEDLDDVSFSISGHSGSAPSIAFLSEGERLPDEKAKFSLLQKMIAHSMYTEAGDYTLLATKMVTDRMREEASADGGSADRYVFIFSDANFDRYGITAQNLSGVLHDESGRVSVHCLLIASLDDEAARLARELPNSCHLCLDTTELPKILRNILVDVISR